MNSPDHGRIARLLALGELSLAWVLACAVSTAAATPPPTDSQAGPGKSAAVAGAAHKSRFPIGGMPEGARQYYAETYGVDGLAAQLTQSGQLVRFSYHVIDASKAQALQDRASTPNMYDEAVHAVLVVPTMEKVGPLRQSMPAENGMAYWMTFSNRGGLVKVGHKVTVVIGSVRIDGLTVQ
jgi:hypothetical protein